MGVNFRKLKTTIMKDLFSVDGKVIVITGATGILGSAMVKHFAEQGAKVVILARNEQMGGDLMAEVKAAGGEALYLTNDGEYTAKYNFTVYVPTFLCTSLDKEEDRFKGVNLMRIINLLNKYKPAGRTYQIKLYDYE